MKKALIIYALVALAAAAHAGQPRLSARAAIAASPASDDICSAYITIDPDALDRDALSDAGVKVALELDTVLTARLPLSAIEKIADIQGVKYIQTASSARQMIDLARADIGADDVLRGTGIDTPLNGKGVVVGIVDCGFDYGHNTFRASDGSLRIKRVWEQGATPSAPLTSPEKFGYGVELIDPQAILDAGGDIRNNSHGTHVASLAAGNDSFLDGAALRGIAPEADIVLVSMTEGGSNNVNISNAIAYIFDYADEVGLPCVVNLSLGAHSGPHDGTSTFDAIADRLQGEGRIIVGAAGNDRAAAFHAVAEFESADADPLRTFIDYRNAISAQNVGGDIEIWGEPGTQMEVSLLVVKTSTGEVAERVLAYPLDNDAAAATLSLGRNITGSFSVASEISPLNGKPLVMLTSAVTGVRTGYAIALEVKPLSAGKVNVWADNHTLGLSSKGIDGYADANGPTICEIGGTAKRILTVGAYTTRNKYNVYGTNEVKELDETIGSISSFSSCGPTADGRMKPQVAAPGCFISSAVSSYDDSGTLVIDALYNDGERDHAYGFMQGTSMATPIVAGAVATWLQAYPQLDPETLVEIVSATARADQYTGAIAANDCDWGYGKIDALAGAKECLRRANSGLAPIIRDDARIAYATVHGDNLRLLVANDAKQLTVSVFSPSGTTVATHTYTSVAAGTEINIQLPLPVSVIRLSTPAATQTIKAAH